MSNDPSSARRILPQSSQMSSFSFQPQQFQQRETQKNYVFVDEHNRHKRLKVMRACEGCRRRKIKCDAATTNTWPCSACIRLRLHCVRPNGQYDGPGDGGSYDESTAASDYQEVGHLQDTYRQIPPNQQQHQPQQSMMTNAPKPDPAMYAAQAAYQENPGMYHPVSYADAPASQQSYQYGAMPPASMMGSQQYEQHHIPSPPHRHAPSADSPPEGFGHEDAYQPQDLSSLLGSLKVDEAGSAPYLRNRASFRDEEEPALEDQDDYRSALPPIIQAPGSKIRIPPELMPDDETAMHYFDLFFAHVHPYVPVLSRTMFYQQWNTKREAVSPLIVEAIFSIGGRLADEPALGQQWLAMVDSHADAFMDVPRLSTLQALLIVLKAREAAPRRGYYYRSWMTVVQCVQMAKDLGLDEHYYDHQADKSCGSSAVECQLKTRIWQVIFAFELMIGSPQGRTDLAVEMDSVDFSIPRPIPGGDESEYHISRNFTYLVRIIRTISRLNSVYGRIKKTRRKDWGNDPELATLNPALVAWHNDLPGDLSITFPPDGSTPWLSSTFIGNLHSYYHMSVILLHRPQLMALDPNGTDAQWKHHMMICYTAAKALCRLQEAILGSFGLTGLQCMLRGYSFTVYCGLCCIVLHLVAITSPDPELHSDAREYFARQMRVLEKVMQVWPMADLQKQVDAVREAFSADVRKPFVLKPSFPYGSPHTSHTSASPRSAPGYQPSSLGRAETLGHGLNTQNLHQQPQVSYTSPLTPPISAGPADTKSDSPALQSLVMMTPQGTQASGMPQTMPLADAPPWNPQRIFEQWNSSFGTPQVQPPSTSVPTQPNAIIVSPPTGQPEAPSVQDIQAANAHMSVVPPQHMAQPQYSSTPMPPAQAFVTPAMWQESVASVYEGGLKRSWDYEGSQAVMKRQHR